MNKEFEFYFKGNVLYIKLNIPIKANTIQEIINSVKITFPNTYFKFVAFRNIIGYWAAFNYENSDSIYCGSMNVGEVQKSIDKYEIKQTNGKI